MEAGEAVSPRLTGGQEAVPITLDLRGSRTLALTVEVGGDTYDHDQAIWGDAAILLEDGSRVPLASLTPEETQVGWGTLLREGRNHLGKPLTVGGKTFASGLWSHAPAFLLYALPEGAVRFEAKVGIDANAGTKGSVVFRAEKGVILASGGFAANRKLLRQYAPEYASLPIDGLPSSTGDMLTAALEIGADAVNLGFVECIPGAPPGIDYQVRLDYNSEDCIMVNSQGRRFTKETGTRREIAAAVSGQKGPCYEIADQGSVERMIVNNQKDLWRGYFAKVAVKDDTPEGLARRLGLPEAALVEELGRALKSGKFEKPPFWGVRIHLRIHCTLGGLRIDEKARVLGENSRPIPGLRATGSLVGNVHGINRLGANGLNSACVFGRIAGAETARGL